ncbi:MAG: hypothetical protein J5582_14775 [Ruminococcus sp.]|uniref:hypothetical protein n=1 Tax=Ruminococcus sp. TaxID=41978 RepID=UPI0025DFDC2E|nr:hypothetical protein [Ruminococcus sp.]MBO4867801.1 hypothetical protein [Ruminococcus sp.]
MKNLTELLKDIPLEEMTGGLDMNFSEENNTKINVQNSKAKIKNKAPAAIAIAACAAVAVAGAMHYRGNDIPEPGNKQDSSTVTTDAEDTAVKERSPEEELNYELAKRFFEDIDMDITTMGDGLHIMNSKVGTVTEGFEDYDIWVPGVLVNGSEYSVLVAMQTKDGSEFPKDLDYLDYKGDIVIDGYMLSGGSDALAMHIYGDKAIGMQTVDLDNTVYKEAYDPYEDHPDASEVLNADSTVHFEINFLYMDIYDDPIEGVFTAEFKLGDVIFNSQNVNEEKQANEAYAKLYYDINGYDYELAKKNVFPMESKVGEIKEGFDGLDISLCDIRMCSSGYRSEIDLVIKNKDGSDFAEGISNPDNILNCSSLDVFVVDESNKAQTDYMLSVSKDTAIFTIYVDWSGVDEESISIDDDPDITIRLRDLYSTTDDNKDIHYDGLFEAVLKPEILEEIDCEFPEFGRPTMELTNGSWDISEYASIQEPQNMKYNVGEINFSNCEIMTEIFGNKDLDELRDALTLAWQAQAEKNKSGKNRDNSNDPESDFDYDFIKLELDDGTIEIPHYKDVEIMGTEKPDKNGKTEKGYIMIFDCLDTPFDAVKVKAIHVGSAVITIK